MAGDTTITVAWNYTDGSDANVTREQVLAAVVAGQRTKKQIAAHLGITLHPVLKLSLRLSEHLIALHCTGLVSMKTTGDGWSYTPTRRGRLHAA